MQGLKGFEVVHMCILNLFLFVVIGIKPRMLCMPDTHSTTDPYSHP